MPRDLRAEVIAVMEETITELSSACELTAYDIYGSTSGWHVIEFKTREVESITLISYKVAK